MDDELANDPFFAEAMAEREEEEAAARKAARVAPTGKAGGKAGGKTSAKSGGGGIEADSEGARGGGGGSGAAGGKADKGKKGKKGKKGALAPTAEEAAAAAREAAELELLMMGDGEEEAREVRRGYDLKQLQRKERDLGGVKGAKRRRAEAAAAAAAAVDADAGFDLDLADQRFSSIYSSVDFAIDPTDPKFRKTAGSEKILGEVCAPLPHRPPPSTPARLPTC